MHDFLQDTLSFARRWRLHRWVLLRAKGAFLVLIWAYGILATCVLAFSCSHWSTFLLAMAALTVIARYIPYSFRVGRS